MNSRWAAAFIAVGVVAFIILSREGHRAEQVPTAELASNAAPRQSTASNPEANPDSGSDLSLNNPDRDDETAEAVKDLQQEQIARESAVQLRETVESAFRAEDNFKLNAARNNLLIRSQQGDGASLQALQQLLMNIDPRIAKLAAQILAEVATPEALDILLKAAENTKEDRRRTMLLKSIRGVGEWHGNDTAQDRMNSQLESFMATLAPTDSAGYEAAAYAVAGVGAPDGVARLLESIKGMPADSAALRASRHALAEALKELRNPAAVPILARELVRPAARTDIASIAGDALAALGLPVATQTLIDWATQAQSSYETEKAVTWLSMVRDPRSLKLLLKIGERDDFQNKDLRRRLLEVGKRLANQLS